MSDSGAAATGAGGAAATGGAASGAGQGGTAAATSAAANGAGASPAWYAELAAEDIGWLQNRGLADPDAAKAAPKMAQQFRQLEGLRGIPADRIFSWPKPEDGLDAVWAKLGVPAKAEDYTFGNHTWEDTPEARETKGLFADLGARAHLTEEQIGLVLDFFNEASAAVKGEDDGAKAARIAEANDIIKQSWGARESEFNALADVGMARIAELMQEAGNTKMVERSEGALKALTEAGYGDWGRELLRVIGRGLGEDRARLASGAGNGQAMTREELEFRIKDAHNLNSEIGSRYAKNDPGAMRQVHEWIVALEAHRDAAAR